MKYIYLSIRYRSIIKACQSVDFTYSREGHKDIIWWFWLQGIDNAPEVCKVCLESLRHWHPDKKIIILDKGNLSQYVTLPDYIEDKHERGIMSHTHYSDLIRLQLLYEHGGTWIDSTVYCMGRRYEGIMHLPLFIFCVDSFTSAGSNWFMVSDPHNPVIKLTRDLLFAYWKDHNYLLHYFIFHMFLKMASKALSTHWEHMPYISNRMPREMIFALSEDYSDDKMKYFESISDFHKLTYKYEQYKVFPSPSSIISARYRLLQALKNFPLAKLRVSRRDLFL